MFKQRTVIPLIDKKTGLLSTQPIDMKAQPILHCNIGVITTYYITILGIKIGFIWQCCFRFIIHIFYFQALQVGQSFCHLHTVEVHTWRMSLKNGR